MGSALDEVGNHQGGIKVSKPKKKSQTILYILFGLLILSLGGFGVTNYGGTARRIGSVGATDISASEYQLAIRNALLRMQLQGREAPSLATREGEALTQNLLSQLVGATALQEETARLGISIEDDRLRNALLSDQNFQGLDGNFDRGAYTETLRRIGMNESQYEANLRRRMAAELTSAAIVAGIDGHETMVDILAGYVGERRDMRWLKLDASALDEPIPAPTEDELTATYEANPEAYTLPEIRKISYAALTPELVLDKITVDEDELLQLYESRSAEYNRPEHRLVERLVFSDQAEADAAQAALDEGATFESVVQGRGLALTDIDLGDVSEADLGEAGEAVFAADVSNLVGPIETDLGPAIFRVNAILEAESTPFEDVRDDLTDELQRDRASRYISERQEEIDDLIVGGATLEELVAETDMELGTIELAPDTAEDIAAYAEFREAAMAAREDDYLDLIGLSDGGLVSLRLDEVVPPALQPLEDVRDQVAAAWTLEETEKRLGDLGEVIRADRLEGTDFQEMGYTPEIHSDLARESYLDGSVEDMIASLFAMKEGGVEVFAEGETLHIIEVAKITPISDEAPETEELKSSISENIARTGAQDLLELFARTVESQSGISLNQAVINAIHANFP